LFIGARNEEDAATLYVTTIKGNVFITRNEAERYHLIIVQEGPFKGAIHKAIKIKKNYISICPYIHISPL
jgi:hypothetical protein